jgi:hypothetical protein
MAFDPCRAWLGLPAIELVDPWRVLGLTAGAGDAEAVARAAEARLAALRRVQPGPFAKAHAALIAKVEEARDTLLAQAFLQEPPPRQPDRLPPTPPPAFPAPVVAQPPPQQPRAGSGLLPDLPVGEVDIRPVIRRTPRRKASRSAAGGLLLTTLALLATAVAVMLALVMRPELFARWAGFEIRQAAAGKATVRPNEPKPEPAGRQSPPDHVPPPDHAPPPDRVAPPDRRVVGSARALRPPEPTDTSQPRPPRQEEPSSIELAGPPHQAADSPAAERELRRRAAEAIDGEPERARLRESLDESLGDTFAALRRGEFEAADRTLAAAGKQVGDDVEAATRIDGWRLLLAYAREFPGYRDRAFAAANQGRDYAVDGRTISVIEITPELFIYKLDGRIVRTSRARIDPRIELAIVESWFAADGRAANHLFLGAGWLCLDPPNVGRARAEWQTAGAGGEQVAPLLALLDDPIIRRIVRRPKP